MLTGILSGVWLPPRCTLAVSGTLHLGARQLLEVQRRMRGVWDAAHVRLTR